MSEYTPTKVAEAMITLVSANETTKICVGEPAKNVVKDVAEAIDLIAPLVLEGAELEGFQKLSRRDKDD